MTFPIGCFKIQSKHRVPSASFFLFLLVGLLSLKTYANPGNDNKHYFQDTVPTTRVTGKVTSVEDGLPLPGASIQNMRTGRITVTNASGIFFIEALRGDSLHISFAGKVAQSIMYSGQTAIELSMIMS
jgi:hypothetical protein